MVTITLHCSHWQCEALLCNGHAPNGKQLSRCRTCGRQSRENISIGEEMLLSFLDKVHDGSKMEELFGQEDLPDSTSIVALEEHALRAAKRL